MPPGDEASSSLAHGVAHVSKQNRCGYWSGRKPLISVAPTGNKLVPRLLNPNRDLAIIMSHYLTVDDLTEYEQTAGPIATSYHHR